MSGMPIPVIAGLFIVVSFFCSLAVYSLRDFSRSRLDEICRGFGRESRFGEILKRHEDALFVMECLLWVCVMATVCISVARPLPPASLGIVDDRDGFLRAVIEFALLTAGLAAVVVVLPRTVARVAGERYLYHAWPVLATLIRLSRPALHAARQLDKFVHRLSGLQEPDEGDAAALTEEILTVVDEGQREGVLESEARTMIHRVMELAEEDAAAIMTPRTEMHCIPADSSLAQARQRLLEAGHSRMPVIGETTDDIVGILYAKDLLKYQDASLENSVSLKTITREPFYVPETTHVDTLLETMKRDRVHLAIVIDEYSGVAGLVTLEDILEEIVGEIIDEHDAAEEQGIHTIAPGVIEVEARVHVDDLNEQFDFNLPEDGDFDTIGGFVFAELGCVPTTSQHLVRGQLRITVLEADERKIHRLRIEVDQTLAAKAVD